MLIITSNFFEFGSISLKVLALIRIGIWKVKKDLISLNVLKIEKLLSK